MILSRPVFTRALDQSAQVSRPHFVASINARMSDTRHAVVRGPSLTGDGNRPSATPCHQVERPTGIIARIVGRRTNPISGRLLVAVLG